MKRTMAVIGLFFGLVSFSRADTYTWIDSTGGGMSDPAKWDLNAVPGADDYVFFKLPNTYTVQLDDNYTHDRLVVEGSDLTLDLAGFEYVLDTTDDNNQSILIGDSVSSTLSLSSGQVYCRDLFTGRNTDDVVGTLNLSGGAVLTGHIDGWYGFHFGTSGESVVSITEDSQLKHGHGASAIYQTSQFLIDGEYSEWYVDGYFQMSYYGKTTVDIKNGARARFARLDMSIGMNSSTLMNVTGTGHQTEVAVEGSWDPICLYLGMKGSAAIHLAGSKLYAASAAAIGSEKGGSGELHIHDGSWADIAGSLGVGGTPETPGGEGLIWLNDETPGNGDYVDLSCAWDEGNFMVIWPEGTVRLNAGEITMEYDLSLANPIFIRGGRLEGWGWIHAHVVNESGLVRPGVKTEWKDLNITYSYEQGPAATLKIGIGGTYQAWDYAVLRVNDPDNGQVTLDGTLDVDLLYGFVPDYNDQFVIIQAQSVSGQFSNAPSQVIFEDGTFDVIYESNQVVLTHYQASPKCETFALSDLNRDCAVNMADLAILANQWLQ